MRFNFSRPRSPETPAAPAAEERSLASPEEWLSELFGSSPATSGVSVGPSTAMRSTAVRGCVAAISEATSQLLIQIVETSGGIRKEVKDHPLVSLLNLHANPWTSASSCRQQLVQDALLHGFGALWIGRDGAGTVRELIRIKPNDVQIDDDPLDIFAPPIVRLRGLVVDPKNLIIVACPLGSTGASGISPVQDCREAIGLSIALEQTEAALVKNAARPGGVLSFSEKLTPDQLSARSKNWKATFGRLGGGGTAVIDGGGKFDPLQYSLVDAQFEQLRQFQLAEIARAFRVPPVLLQDYGRATWANSSEMLRVFVNLTLMPWLLKIEGELSLKLFSQDEREHLCLEHDVDQLVNADPLERAQTAQAFRSAGVMTANELRRLENLPPHADGDALTNPYVDTAKVPTSGGPTNV